MSINRSGRLGRWFAAGLVVTGVVLLAACGNSADSTSAPDANASTASSTATVSAGPDRAEYASCMAENGVPLPERPSGAPPSRAPQGDPPAAREGMPPEGVDEDTWTAAVEACKEFMPSRPSAPPPTSN
jgi:hypothetical protein